MYCVAFKICSLWSNTPASTFFSNYRNNPCRRCPGSPSVVFAIFLLRPQSSQNGFHGEVTCIFQTKKGSWGQIWWLRWLIVGIERNFGLKILYNCSSLRWRIIVKKVNVNYWYTIPAVYDSCFRANSSERSNITLYWPSVPLEDFYGEQNRQYRKKTI